MNRSTLLVAALALSASAQGAIELSSATFGALSARSIGPAVMSGRISALDGVVNADGPITLYIGTASGGVWKSDDGGIVYRPIFDDHMQSIGAVRVDPSNPETVWVGTGESWVRNTVSPGDGVYRSTDGGEKWQHLGLEDSDHIAELLVHPDDSNTVYVCALGHLWAPGGDRGVFRTTDGGETWENVLKIDDATSCADLAMTPDAGVLYAGMWQVRRYPDFFESGGETSGLYRSTDGGQAGPGDEEPGEGSNERQGEQQVQRDQPDHQRQGGVVLLRAGQPQQTASGHQRDRDLAQVECQPGE